MFYALFLALLTTLWAPAGAAPSFRAPLEAADLDGSLAEPIEVPLNWRTVETVYTRVHSVAGDADVARRMARHAEEAVPRLAGELGLPPGRTMDIFIAPDDETFTSMQPGAPPDWADGTAWPQRGLIFLHSPSARDGTASPLEQVLDHEIVHILLGRAFAPRRVPRWLQEGTAQLLAREYTPDLTDKLAVGVLGGSLMTTRELTAGFPSDPVRAQLAYAQSADLVAFIRNRHGEQDFREIVRLMAAGDSVEASVRKATGESLDQLNAVWSTRLDDSFLWLRPLVSDSTLLALAGFGLVGAGFFRLRRRKIRRREWEQEEATRDAIQATLRAPWPDHPDLVVMPGATRFDHPEAAVGNADPGTLGI